MCYLHCKWHIEPSFLNRIKHFNEKYGLISPVHMGISESVVNTYSVIWFIIIQSILIVDILGKFVVDLVQLDQ